MLLSSLGWDAALASSFEPLSAQDPSLLPGRVAAEAGPAFRVLAEAGEHLCEVAGRLRHEAASRAELPAVGDWVAFIPLPGDAGSIRAVLPRRGCFSRQTAGAVTDEQVVAANVDTLFLIMGLDGDFNPRRLERLLLLAWQGGARPVVLLNKVDLCPEPALRVREIEASAAGVPVHLVSAATGQGLPGLESYLVPGQTVALLGSSGVGKSTLLNRLTGEDRQPTAPVRERDDRGRHTTTRRELFVLPGGALLVDTPGLRELQLWADEESLGAVFDDVGALAAACAFRDCTHGGEPRCAVRAAVAEGRLGAGRLASYLKLQAEVRSLETRHDLGAAAAERRRWRSIHREARRHRPRE